MKFSLISPRGQKEGELWRNSKLLSCDLEITGTNLGNNLSVCRIRLCTFTLPKPYQMRGLCTGPPFYHQGARSWIHLMHQLVAAQKKIMHTQKREREREGGGEGALSGETPIKPLKNWINRIPHFHLYIY